MSSASLCPSAVGFCKRPSAGRHGLTGLWQVKGRNTTTYQQCVAHDVEYLRNWSFLRDAGIILVTVATRGRRQGRLLIRLSVGTISTGSMLRSALC
jgi:lipopolysaccharide/colanic/teichoic acid biosynthesis glycosyltransferase